MATVNFQVLGKGKSSAIYCRFLHTRKIDIKAKTGILVNPLHWDKKHQKIKNVLAVKNRETINKKLLLLKIELIDNFNTDYIEGEIIDKIWLENKISQFFNRPKEEDNKHAIYFCEFANWWLKIKAPTWLVSANSYMSKNAKRQYANLVQLVQDFEKEQKTKVKLNKNAHETLTKFVFFLNKNKYAETTIKKHISRVKFFYNRATEESFKIDNTYKKRIFIPKSEQITEPYLNEEEIRLLYNLELDDTTLNNARDNLIIACYTGLRISDFNNKLDISNFIDDYIEITTTKTKTTVVIPVHPLVKQILIKHKGRLPNKVADATFNKQIKKVCKIANLNEIIKGKIYDNTKKRKVTSLYEKYKLVTSHIGRRSFATNLFGKIELHIISAILGHSSTNQTLEYIKKGNREHAERLKEYWENTTQNG